MIRIPLCLAGLLLLTPTVACSAAPAPLPPVSAADEEAERAAIFEQVRVAVSQENFAELTRMGADFLASRARSSSGTWLLAAYHAALQSYLADGLTRDQKCVYHRSNFIDRWRSTAPKSPAPVITDAALILERGWCLRGNSYAAQVPADVWPQFHGAVDEAFDRLDLDRATASTDPEFYVVKLNALRSGGADRKVYRATIEEAVAREPDYQRTYFKAALGYLPEWGGSFEEVDRFARWAASKGANDENTGLYARIYWSLEECGCDVISRSADWNLMRQAMADSFTRFPVRWNAQYFADTACRHNDVEEGRRYIRAMHPQFKDTDLAALFTWCNGRANQSKVATTRG